MTWVYGYGNLGNITAVITGVAAVVDMAGASVCVGIIVAAIVGVGVWVGIIVEVNIIIVSAGVTAVVCCKKRKVSCRTTAKNITDK
jgi:hypothetical protein